MQFRSSSTSSAPSKAMSRRVLGGRTEKEMSGRLKRWRTVRDWEPVGTKSMSVVVEVAEVVVVEEGVWEEEDRIALMASTT